MNKERVMLIAQLVGTAIAGLFSAILAVIGVRKEIKAAAPTPTAAETPAATPVQEAPAPTTAEVK